jgi:glycosyltransferase involved in cell wall biosynthesis
LPLIGSYHTELTAYAQLRSERAEVAAAMQMAVGAFYNACDLVLSPSPASDEALMEVGLAAEKIVRWDRGVDTERFDPALRSDRRSMPNSGHTALQSPLGKRKADGRTYVLYAGRITKEKGIDLLVDSFLAARERDGRLHLLLAGGGPEREWVAARLGEHATFLGWLSGEGLARAYARADAFLFCSQTDTFGQVILEAQASGVPVVAVAAGGPASLIDHGVTGLLCEPSAAALAYALVELTSSPLLRERLSLAGQGAVKERTWERALQRLAGGYDAVLAGNASAAEREAA